MIHRNFTNIGLVINTLPYVIPAQIPIASGTVMLFQQTNAPVGWTKVTTHNDKTLRLVSGAASSGGTTAFSTVFTNQSLAASIAGGVTDGTTLTTAMMPAHTHLNGGQVGWWGSPYSGAPYGNVAPNVFIGSANNANVNSAYIQPNNIPGGPNIPVGGGSHNHTVAAANTTVVLGIQYVDIILASKN